jgi:hypothetical protein
MLCQLFGILPISLLVESLVVLLQTLSSPMGSPNITINICMHES